MTAKPTDLWTVLYEEETNFGEDTDTLAASGTRLQCLGEPQVSLTQDRIAELIAKQYMGESKAGVLGPMGGQISLEFALTGHGGTTAGALTATDLHRLMEIAIGAGDTDESGDAVDTGPTNAYTFATVSETYNTRSLIRVGAFGDGRAEGQWAAVNSQAPTLVLLNALPATPNAADVIYASQTIYPPTAPSTSSTVQPTRWLVMTSNGQWIARGCTISAMSIASVNIGEQPRLSVTLDVGWWETTSETFPSAVATAAKDGVICAPNCCVQDVGTVTRAEFDLRSWSLDIALNVIREAGNDGYSQYSVANGAKRVSVVATMTTEFDAEAAGTTTWLDKFNSGTLQQIMMGLSFVDGKALAVYFQNAELMSAPQQTSSNGLNRVTCQWRALPDVSQSTDRARAAFIIGMG